jgi:hypothetical protein
VQKFGPLPYRKMQEVLSLRKFPSDTFEKEKGSGKVISNTLENYLERINYSICL